MKIKNANMRLLEDAAKRGAPEACRWPKRKERTMRFALIMLVVLSTLTTGCTTGSNYYNAQAQNLRYAYESGQITANDYYARMNELQMLAQQDQARRQQAAYNMQQGLQRQQQLNLQQQQAMMQTINSFQPQTLNTTRSAPANNSWDLQYNTMNNSWQYAPPNSRPRYNPMEDTWQMAP